MEDQACCTGLEIGRAHVLTPVTNAHRVCRLLLEQKKQKKTKHTITHHTKNEPDHQPRQPSEHKQHRDQYNTAKTKHESIHHQPDHQLDHSEQQNNNTKRQYNYTKLIIK